MEPFFSEYFYLNLYRNNTYAGNCGFLKWEMEKEKHRVTFCLKNLPRDYRNCMVKNDRDELLWNFTFSRECQAIVWQFSLEKEPALAEKLERMKALEIWLETGVSCKTQVSLPIPVQPRQPMENVLEAERSLKIKEKKETEAWLLLKKEESKFQETQSKKEEEKSSDAILQKSSEKPIELEKPSKEPENREIYPIGSSWENLCKLYTVVHPFRDDREFLSVTIKDFPTLGDCQKLSHNSFLLHGFYNYQHLILGKVDPEKEQYYIGVPGVYQEREKKSAQMFGFVGFEGIDREIIRGCFGYYMIEVSL